MNKVSYGQSLVSGTHVEQKRVALVHIDLEIRSGDEPAYSVRSEGPQIVIGSGPACDVSIKAPERQMQYVGIKHAQIDLSTEGVQLTDLGSDHGTLLNGRSLIESVQLREGNRVRLGRLGPEILVKAIDLEKTNKAVRSKTRNSMMMPIMVGSGVLVLAIVGFFVLQNSASVDEGGKSASAPVQKPNNQGASVGVVLDDSMDSTETVVQRPAEPLVEHYALLVGVSGYDTRTGLHSLRYPEKDVNALAEVLVQEMGYPKENVQVMTASRGSEDFRFLPIRQNIERELKGFLQQREKGDNVLVAFSGHGVQFGSEPFFCPADADLEDRATLFSFNLIYEALKDCPAEVKLLLTDACRNDPFQASSRRAIVDLKSETRPQEIAPPGGLAVMFSCAGGQKSWEHEELGSSSSTEKGQGVFFHYVIEGFRHGDQDENGQLTISELRGYTQKRVKDFVWNKFGEVQTPAFRGEFVDEPILINFRPQAEE